MYYEVTVTVVQAGPKGGQKKSKEKSLVKAVSPTDVDTKMHEKYKGFPLEWNITNLRVSDIIEVID